MDELNEQVLFSLSSKAVTIDNKINKKIFEIKHVCNYCGSKKKKEMLIACNYQDDIYINTDLIEDNDKLFFCDFACAKLFNDNKYKISIDIKKYREAFLKERLDSKAKRVYVSCSKTCFLLLPKLTVSDDNYKLHRLVYLKSI